MWAQKKPLFFPVRFFNKPKRVIRFRPFATLEEIWTGDKGWIGKKALPLHPVIRRKHMGVGRRDLEA